MGVREGNSKGFIRQIDPFPFGEWRRTFSHSTLQVLDQKIPDRLTKLIFLGDVGTAVKSGRKSRFGL